MTDAPNPQLTDYPAAVGVALGVLFTAILLVVSGRFDPTNGVLTLSILVVISFVGIVMFSLLFAIPAGETNAAVVGGMTAAFGAIVAYWLGRGKGNS
jgi:FtsH-binding integral membrane protein